MSPRRARAVALLVILLSAIVWLLVVLRLGVWSRTWVAAPGVLSYTFDGWHAWPVARHLFLGQYEPTDLAQGRGYASYSYPFLFAMYALVAPFHHLLGVPFSVAHNVLPYLQVLAFLALFAAVTRAEIGELIQATGPSGVAALVLLAGSIVTTPAAWSAMMLFNRDNPHGAVALVFRWLSLDLYRGSRHEGRFLVGGIFIGLYAPIYFPAWLLGRLCLDARGPTDRRFLVQGLAVATVSLVSLGLPRWIGRFAEVRPVSSGYLYRSGLDGSREWVHGLVQAILWPSPGVYQPYQRTSLAVHVAAVLVALALLPHGGDTPAGLGPGGPVRRRMLAQAAFLAVPYLSVAILFPQFTAIHPYLTDVLLLVPSSFLLGFWSVQADLWPSSSGRRLCFWVLGAMFVLMTDLLHLAQALRTRP